MAPEARFKLTTGASHAPVLFTTPPGSDSSGTHCRATRTGLEPVPPGLTIRCSSVELTRQVGPDVPESGWPESNRRPRRPERRALPACATARCDSSGGRGRSPASWFRARCASSYTTPEWCVPGGSNSDPRGKSPLGYQLPQRRRGREPGPLVRATALERRPPGRGRGGRRHRRVGRRSTGLSPGYGRRGSNSHGPGPPASEAGASTNSATSAEVGRRHPTTSGRRRSARPSGPRRTRTVFVLLAGEVHCHSCVGPMSPRGRSRTCLAKAPGLRPGAVPRRQTRGWGSISGREWHSTRPSIPLLAISSIVKELFGRDEPSLFAQMARRTRRGARESNPVFGGFGSRPATGASPLCRAVLVLCRSGNQKSRLHVEAALERSQTLEGPVHPFESASLERRSKHIACSTPACDVTRDVDRATCPSIHR